MFESGILDVGIGLGFVFLMLSLMVTAVSEMLASALKWRATHLWLGIEQLLQSSAARNELYGHPLIKGLTRMAPQATDWKQGKNGPSYIPSRTFALALIDTIRRPHAAADSATARLQQVVHAAATDPATMVAEISGAIAELSSRDVPEEYKAALARLKERILAPVAADVIEVYKGRVREVLGRIPAPERAAVAGSVLDWLNQPIAPGATYLDVRAAFATAVDNLQFAGPVSDQARTTLRQLLAQFAFGDPERAIQAVNAFGAEQAGRWLENASEPLRRALTPLLQDAAGDVDRFRENIEIWFNDGMDRVSGWYKRHTGAVQFAIALAMSVALNVDALMITRTLWREPALRESIVNQAAGVVANPPASLAPPDVEQRGEGAEPIVLTLASPTVDAGKVLTVYVAVPSTASAGETLHVVPASGLIKLRQTEDGADAAALDLAAAPGQATQFYVKALDTSADSRERVKVTSTPAGKTGQADFIVRPSPDQRFDAVRSQVSGLGLPIGWRECDPREIRAGTANFWCSLERNQPFYYAYWLLGIVAIALGWLLTAAAASLGAPFWFDTLKRFVSIRSAGKAPEERPLAPKEVPQPREPGQRPKDADLLNVIRGR
jgi:hypothetical protein